MIEIKNISKSFSDRKVINDISFNFVQGKTNIIIGESGSGKTTLLKCMVGLNEIDAGEVLFDGRNFYELDFKGKKEIRKEIGMLFQGGALFAVVSDATGVNEFFNGMKLTTYPNPTTQNVTIEYTLEKNASTVKLMVINSAGQSVINNTYNAQSAGTYKVNLDVTNLAAGTYFYQLNAGGHNFTKQLVITK